MMVMMTIIEVEAHDAELNDGIAKEAGDDNVADGGDDVDTANEGDNANTTGDDNIADDIKYPFPFDIFDPRNWDALDPKMIDVLVQKGPKRESSIQQGKRDNLLEGFLQYHILEFSQMGKSVTENGLCTTKILTRYFVFAANY